MKEKDLVYTLALFSNFQALQDWKLLLVLVVFLIVDVTFLSIFTLLPAAWLNGRFQMVRSKYFRGGQSDATESAEAGNGLESLRMHTHVVLQNENEALKAELKKYQVRPSLYTAYCNH